MDIEAQVHSLDRALLTGLVRQVARRPTAEIIDWQYRSIYQPVVPTTAGVYRLMGHAADGAESVPWSLVLKIVRAPAATEVAAWGDNLSAASYWKRDILMYQSGLLTDLPGGLAAPRCLLITEQPDEVIWMWLEDIVDECPRWPLARYRLAARHLGRFNGTFLVDRVLPTYPWLTKDLLRWYSGYDADRFADLAQVGEHRRVQRIWTDGLRLGLKQLWAAREGILTLLDRLPQTLCHRDAGRLNLFARQRPDDSGETVVIDWGWAGVGAIGEELAPAAIASALRFQDIEPAQLPELAEVAFEGYLEGLGEAGWRGDPRHAQLGFLGTMALRYGLFPLVEAWPDEQQDDIERVFGHPVDELAERVAAVRRFVLEQVASVQGLV